MIPGSFATPLYPTIFMLPRWPKLLAHLNSIGRATWAIWAAIKKDNLTFSSCCCSCCISVICWVWWSNWRYSLAYGHDVGPRVAVLHQCWGGVDAFFEQELLCGTRQCRRTCDRDGNITVCYCRYRHTENVKDRSLVGEEQMLFWDRNCIKSQ